LIIISRPIDGINNIKGGMMKIAVNVLITISFLSTALVSGCASTLIEKKIGSEGIAVVDANKVSGCESKGGMKASVLAKIWFVNRNAQSVEENLLQMARNSAVDDNADTIVKGESKQLGERTYFFYKCR
jgi:uncharacterized protein YceK